jgi:protease-4
VAYVVAAGTIASGRSRYTAAEGVVLGSETMSDVLREVADRPAIKAVVLRIDSPGGDALATDEIWHEVERLSAAKPVVVSMSDIAASGGYYVAAPARRIVAEPATLTGSIGVYGGKLNLIGLWRKLGLNVEIVSRGRHAQILSLFRDFTPEEAARYQTQIETTYQRFLARVADGRGLTLADVDSAARGRLWTGMEALSLGLVDTLGGIRTAFELALESADLPRDVPLMVERYPKIRRSFLDRLVESWFADENDQDAYLRLVSPVMRAWVAAAQFPAGRALTLTPWSVTIR